MTPSKDNTQTPVTPATDEQVGHLLFELEDRGISTPYSRTVLALIARIRASEPVWQDIATAPRDGTRIDVWCKRSWLPPAEYERKTNIYWCKTHKLWRTDGQLHFVESTFDPKSTYHLVPTHWMPLPSPPKPLSYEGDQS